MSRKIVRNIQEFDEYRAKLRANGTLVPWFSEPSTYPCLTFLYAYAENSNDFAYFYLEDLRALEEAGKNG